MGGNGRSKGFSHMSRSNKSRGRFVAARCGSRMVAGVYQFTTKKQEEAIIEIVSFSAMMKKSN